MVSILGGWYWGEGIKTQAENTETQNNPKIPQSRRKLAWCQIQVLHSEKIPSIDILYIYTQYIIATAMPHGFSNRHRESCWYSTTVLTCFDMLWHVLTCFDIWTQLCHFYVFILLTFYIFLLFASFCMFCPPVPRKKLEAHWRSEPTLRPKLQGRLCSSVCWAPQESQLMVDDGWFWLM